MFHTHSVLAYEHETCRLGTHNLPNIGVVIKGTFTGRVGFFGLMDGRWVQAKCYPFGTTERHLAQWEASEPSRLKFFEPQYEQVEVKVMELSHGSISVELAASQDMAFERFLSRLEMSTNGQS